MSRGIASSCKSIPAPCTGLARKPGGVGHLDAMVVMVKLPATLTPIMPVVHPCWLLPVPMDDSRGAPADTDRDPVVPRPQGPLQIDPPP